MQHSRKQSKEEYFNSKVHVDKEAVKKMAFDISLEKSKKQIKTGQPEEDGSVDINEEDEGLRMHLIQLIEKISSGIAFYD